MRPPSRSAYRGKVQPKRNDIQNQIKSFHFLTIIHLYCIFHQRPKEADPLLPGLQYHHKKLCISHSVIISHPKPTTPRVCPVLRSKTHASHRAHLLFRIVERRWAITTVDGSSSSSPSFFLYLSADVRIQGMWASSKIKSGDSSRSHGGILIRWRCPPGQVSTFGHLYVS